MHSRKCIWKPPCTILPSFAWGDLCVKTHVAKLICFCFCMPLPAERRYSNRDPLPIDSVTMYRGSQRTTPMNCTTLGWRRVLEQKIFTIISNAYKCCEISQVVLHIKSDMGPLFNGLIGIGPCIGTLVNRLLWEVIMHSCHNFNLGLAKSPLKLGTKKYLHLTVLRGCDYSSTP